ncbi:hypothetical protein EK0264_03820 [Epidermidibacterium keratini]|uniref:Uncharacterized protein n=1 Tax=Epidermidibacterium keratini TaxID=1891644 RepID=A0A7L4YKB3_9ACTN|nr:hypothetical protein [Epidermidibacterium keratini]QHB99497.1 hypothetical protein EK0264_03820 [Epidermidibacterium keratini]
MTTRTEVGDTAMVLGGGDKAGVRGWILAGLGDDAQGLDIDAIQTDLLTEWQQLVDAYRPDWTVTAAIVVAPVGYEPLTDDERADLQQAAGDALWRVVERHAS